MKRKQRKTHDFYTVTSQRNPGSWTKTTVTLATWTLSFTYVGSTTHRWPVPAYERKAAKLGFNRWERDQNIWGGYFVNDGDGHEGDILICIPAGFPPEGFV